MNVGTVEVVLQLRDLMRQQLAATQALLKQFEASTKTTTTSVDNLDKSHARAATGIEKFGKQIRTTLVHVAAAGAAYKLLSAAASSVTNQVELVRTFEKIENITGVTRVEVERLRASLNDLSTSTAKGPQELAEGFYFIASAGIKGAQATEILTAAAKASAVGLGETKDIARSITAAINAYGASNLSAAQATDILFAAVREGGAEASEVAGVFGRVVGIAAQLGVSFAEVGSFIATFTRLGVGADEAVTALRGSMTAMLTPTRNQEAALKAVGSSMAELRREVKERGLTAALIDLVKAGKGNEDIIGAIIPNVRSLAGVLGVAGNQAEAYREVTDRVTNSTGDLARAFDDVSQSASFRWDQVKAQFEQLSITLGEGLLPGIQAFSNALAGIDADTVKRVGENLGMAITEIARGLALAVSLLDALSNGFERLQHYLPGLGMIANLWRANTEVLIDYLNYSSRVETVIANIVTEANKAGTALNALRSARDKLTGIQAGDTVTFSEYGKLKEDLKAAESAVVDLVNQRDKLASSQKDEIQRFQLLINLEVLRRDALKKTVQTASDLERITHDVVKQQPPTIKFPDAEAERFAQRLGEVTRRWTDQLAVAKANLEVARARLAMRAGGKGELADELELSQQKRIQLEIDRRIASLENTKHQLSRDLVATITAQVTQEIKLNDEIRDTIALTTEIGKLLKSNAQWQARLRDLIHDSNAKLGAEMTERVANSYAFQNTLLTKQLELSHELLDAWLKGGNLAARAVQIQQERFEASNGLVKLSYEEALALAKVADAQDRINYLIAKMAELAKPAWQIYLDAAFSALNAVGTALSDVIYQAAMEGKVNWESVWQSLKGSLIKIFADMLADMLKRWIATQLAMRAASQSINAAGGASGATAGSSGGMSSLFGGGGAGGTGGGMSVGTMAGIGLAAYALFVVYKGFIEDHKRKFSGVTLGSSGQITSTYGHTKKYLAGVQQAAADILTALNTWMDEMDVLLTSFGTVSIEHDKSGWSVTGLGGFRMAFETAEEALNAAQAMMVRFGEFADSVPALVQSAVRATNVMDMGAISSNIAFARTLLTQNMEQVAGAMDDATQLFIDQMRRSFELFAQAGRAIDVGALTQATSSAILHFSNSLQALYDQLTGHQADPREAAERQRQAYNMQRAVMIAQITLLYEEIRARIADVQSRIALLNIIRAGRGEGGEGGGAGGHGGAGDIRLGGQLPSSGYSNFPFRLKGGGALVQDPRNPTNDPQLAALIAVLDNLARALAGLPPEIGEGGVRPGRGGGRGGQRDSVREFIDNQRFAMAQAGRSPLQQEIEEIRRSFAEQLEAAGRNVALRQQLLDLEAQAVALATERHQAQVLADVAAATGQTNAFSDLRKKFSDLRTAVGAANLPLDRVIKLMRELQTAEEAAVRALSMQMAGDLFGGLAQYIQDETVRAGFLAAQAQIKFELDMENYRIQFELLKANGNVAQAVLDKIQEAFDYIDTHPPVFGAGTGTGGGSGGGIFGHAYDEGWMWVPGIGWVEIPANPAAMLDRARDLLAQYQNEGLSSWNRALKKLNDDFILIRASLGNTPEVAQAYADALARLRIEFLSGIQDFYDAMIVGPDSPLNVGTQFQNAQANYRRLLALVQGGDLSQANALRDTAAQYQQLAAQMYGQGTSPFAAIFAQIRTDFANILGLNPGGNVLTFPEVFAQGNQAVVDASANIASVVDISARRMEIAQRDGNAVLALIDEKLQTIINLTESPISGGFAIGE